MELDKYIGIDTHSSTLVVHARDAFGKVILQSVVPTNAEAIVQCIGGLRGRLHVTFEEGTHAQWLYDVLRKRVQDVLVCNARESRLLQDGSKADVVDAAKMSHLPADGSIEGGISRAARDGDAEGISSQLRWTGGGQHPCDESNQSDLSFTGDPNCGTVSLSVDATGILCRASAGPWCGEAGWPSLRTVRHTDRVAPAGAEIDGQRSEAACGVSIVENDPAIGSRSNRSVDCDRRYTAPISE
jgi:hypothetical protein